MSLPIPIPTDRATLAAVSAEQWQALLVGPADELAGWMQAAARLDDPMAMNMYGRCLEHGWGIAADTVAAAALYLRAAEAGLDWGMYNYANLLAVGKGTPQDHATALAWYRKAAALGHAKSLNLVGRYQEEGLGGLSASRARAFRYYRAAAEGGDFRGQYSYACMLAERGRLDAALMWLRRVPATATPAFLRKAGYELQLSPHESMRQIAREMLARCQEETG